MPTRGNPVAADEDGNSIVELQRHDGRATDGRLAKNSRTVVAPLKMVRPPFAARIEQRHQSPCDRVVTLGLSGLGVVAQAAREP